MHVARQNLQFSGVMMSLQCSGRVWLFTHLLSFSWWTTMSHGSVQVRQSWEAAHLEKQILRVYADVDLIFAISTAEKEHWCQRAYCEHKLVINTKHKIRTSLCGPNNQSVGADLSCLQHIGKLPVTPRLPWVMLLCGSFWQRNIACLNPFCG